MDVGGVLQNLSKLPERTPSSRIGPASYGEAVGKESWKNEKEYSPNVQG